MTSNQRHRRPVLSATDKKKPAAAARSPPSTDLSQLSRDRVQLATQLDRDGPLMKSSERRDVRSYLSALEAAEANARSRGRRSGAAPATAGHRAARHPAAGHHRHEDDSPPAAAGVPFSPFLDDPMQKIAPAHTFASDDDERGEAADGAFIDEAGSPQGGPTTPAEPRPTPLVSSLRRGAAFDENELFAYAARTSGSRTFKGGIGGEGDLADKKAPNTHRKEQHDKRSTTTITSTNNTNGQKAAGDRQRAAAIEVASSRSSNPTSTPDQLPQSTPSPASPAGPVDQQQQLPQTPAEPHPTPLHPGMRHAAEFDESALFDYARRTGALPPTSDQRRRGSKDTQQQHQPGSPRPNTPRRPFLSRTGSPRGTMVASNTEDRHAYQLAEQQLDHAGSSKSKAVVLAVAVGAFSVGFAVVSAILRLRAGASTSTPAAMLTPQDVLNSGNHGNTNIVVTRNDHHHQQQPVASQTAAPPSNGSFTSKPVTPPVAFAAVTRKGPASHLPLPPGWDIGTLAINELPPRDPQFG